MHILQYLDNIIAYFNSTPLGTFMTFLGDWRKSVFAFVFIMVVRACIHRVLLLMNKYITKFFIDRTDESLGRSRRFFERFSIREDRPEKVKKSILKKKARLDRKLPKIEDKLSFRVDIFNYLFKAFDKPIQLFCLILAFFVFLIMCPLEVISAHSALDNLLRSGLIVCFVWGLYNLCDAGHGFLLRVMSRFGLNIDEDIESLISAIAHVICVALGLLMIAKEWNYDITPLVASASIGTLIIGLAAKDTVSNLFGGAVILSERPFHNGDWIKVNNVEGTVEKINFRSTCIRTFAQELVYLPNSLMTSTSIANYTEKKRNRIQFTLGLTYAATKEQIESVCEDIREYCRMAEDIFTDKIEVHFFEFGESSLNIRVVCYAVPVIKNGEDPERFITWAEYLAARDHLNFAIMQILDKNGVSCAFPSRSLYLETPFGTEDMSKGVPSANLQGPDGDF